MLDLIIIGAIIYAVYKKSNTAKKLDTFLQAKGFSKILKIHKTAYSSWFTAILNGDNYLFEVMNSGASVSNKTVNTLIAYAEKAHYHNIILVPGNSIISNTAKTAIKNGNVQIWDNSKLVNLSNISRENSASAIVPKRKLDDNCKIEPSTDPIQDGSKANSILGSFLGNKIEKL